MHALASERFAARQGTRVWAGGGEELTAEIISSRPQYSLADVEVANELTKGFIYDRVMPLLARWVRQGAILNTNWLYEPSSISYSLDVETGQEVISIQEESPVSPSDS